jgi:hypothetical protein
MGSSGTENTESYWLVRTKELFLSRPLTQTDLVKKIEKGDLTPLDEVCPSGGYWFGLHEVEEVRQHLGDVDLSRLSRGLDIEITSSTETRTLNRTLILELPKRAAAIGETLVVPQSLLESTESPAALKPRLNVGLLKTEKHAFPVVLFGSVFGLTVLYLWLRSV